MDLRTWLCFTLSRKLMRPPETRTVDYGDYQGWRDSSLTQSWDAFDDAYVRGKDVLDFGCGDGPLALYLAREKAPRRIVGVDLGAQAIERANQAKAHARLPANVEVEFIVGSSERLPVPDSSFDTLLAFDCFEHVMAPGPILRDWARVLRPGGRCLIEWFPYKGPWGPHMEALIPIPWAHVLFGERAMFRSAELIYDLPEFTPRHWDLDERGGKKPNKWRAWSSFEEQGYINKLDVGAFRKLARAAGFEIARFEPNSFSGSAARRWVGKALMQTPLIGEHFMSFVRIELAKPAH